jgi:CubicO group peptidase (beta-lactamase class C family)
VTVEAVPGSAWRYSGGGYVIVQQLMMDVTGKPFADAMKTLVLDPAGMTSSTFEQPLPAARAGIAASGHQANGLPIPGRWAVFPEAAPGGLWSTPSDLARLAIELRREIDGESTKILSTELAREMVRRQSGDWGLGVSIGGEGGEPRFSHTGNNPGYQSVLIYSTRTRSGVAIMTNGNNLSGFFYEIVYAVAKANGWRGYAPEVRTVVAVDPAILEAYAGTYLASGAPAFTVSTAKGRLYVAGGPFGDEAVELLAESPTTYFILSSGFRFEFAHDAKGAWSLTLGGSIPAKRVSS